MRVEEEISGVGLHPNEGEHNNPSCLRIVGFPKRSSEVSLIIFTYDNELQRHAIPPSSNPTPHSTPNLLRISRNIQLRRTNRRWQPHRQINRRRTRRYGTKPHGVAGCAVSIAAGTKDIITAHSSALTATTNATVGKTHTSSAHQPAPQPTLHPPPATKSDPPSPPW